MPNSTPNASSIPIPDGVRTVGAFACIRCGSVEQQPWCAAADQCRTSDPAEACQPLGPYPDMAVRAKPVQLVASADLPKLYAAWAEGRVEVVAQAMECQGGVPAWPEMAEEVRDCYRREARAALGLGDRA